MILESITTAASAIRTGRISPLSLTEAVLTRIREVNERLHAYVLVVEDTALEQARAAEKELAQGIDRGPLHGIPVGLKDVYATRGLRTTAHSRVLADWIPDEDATAYLRLREAGAVLIGKHGLAEFAFGGPAQDGIFPPPRNPWNQAHEPGGSSSGSAVAVAAGLCFGALGTDAGGSVRKPAAHCGVVGLKPTYGRVSRHGIVPLSWSLDHPGPITRSVEDAAVFLQAIAGPDVRDASASSAPVPDYRSSLERDVDGLRLAIAPEWLSEFGTIDPEILAAFEAAVATLERGGAKVIEVEGAALIAARAANTLIITAEAYAYHEQTLREQPGLLGLSVRKSFREGAFVTAADYLAAQRARSALRDQVDAIFANADAILSPTCPRPAARLDSMDFDAKFHEPSFVNPFNLLGLPAISIPCGFTSDGLPIGLQIAAGPFEEPLVLQIASAYERVTPWHDRHPSVTG